jgi:hypothetical protein
MYSVLRQVISKGNTGANLATFRALNKPIHSSSSLNGTQYYPINDDVFGLTEDQKQVRHSIISSN